MAERGDARSVAAHVLANKGSSWDDPDKYVKCLRFPVCSAPSVVCVAEEKKGDCKHTHIHQPQRNGRTSRARGDGPLSLACFA